MLAICRGRGLRADEQKRIDRVEHGVESAYEQTARRMHFFLHNGQRPEAVLQHATSGHGKQHTSIRAESDAVEQCVCDKRRARDQSRPSESLDESASQTMLQDVVLQEWIRRAQAHETRNAQVVGLLLAAIDVVTFLWPVAVGRRHADGQFEGNKESV